LAKSELEVARIVWELGKATVRQVFDAMPAEREIEFKTVQTYLRRLEAKGYLRIQREGRRNVYVPRVRWKTLMGEAVDDFLSCLFAGNSLGLVQHLIRDRGFSAEELEGVEKLLEQMKADEQENSEQPQRYELRK